MYKQLYRPLRTQRKAMPVLGFEILSEGAALNCFAALLRFIDETVNIVN